MTEADDDQEPLHPGAVVGGKYKLVEPAGSGGMGSVWRAENVSLGNTVAIKFLHMSMANQSPELRARFDREARICAKLGDESLHVVRVMDHGVTDDGRPFLVMELLKGESLSERLEREGRLSVPVASAIVTQLCRALHVAHVAGIVHRDLKPANVFLCRGFGSGNDVHVKLLDFGVAKATLDMDAPQVTRAGFIVGTPAYMSPEQITGQPVDARADLWAVAAIVYRMVVGAPPFGNGTIGQLGRRITSEPPTPPSLVVDDLPPELDEWVRRGLAKKPDDRFQTTSDLSDALAEIAKHAPIEVSARRVVHAQDAPTRAADVAAPTRPAERLPTAAASAATVVDRPRTPQSSAPAPAPASTPASAPPVATHSPRRVRRPVSLDDAPVIEAEEWKPPRSFTAPIAIVLLLVAAGGSFFAYRYTNWFQSAPSPDVSSSASAAPSTPASESASTSASVSASATGTVGSASASGAPATWAPSTMPMPKPTTTTPSTATIAPAPSTTPSASTPPPPKPIGSATSMNPIDENF